MAPKTSYVTVTDQFCGAGGSSIGAVGAGAELRLALNHWALAIETHNTNFPQADHDCTDVSACDPRRYPSTDILITSPECTNHSLAKGKARKIQEQLELFGKAEIDPAEERSRATMWDVVRFAEHHHYRIVIVENVVDARQWTPFPAWLQAMELLGYAHQIVYLNSMFAHPTPQSRDRMYVVFWKKTLRTPDLRFRPRAHCPQCGRDVQAVQSWKDPRRPWGKYGAQYVYRCPECATQVTPYYFCAANAIDWSLPAPRIGDRVKPLKEKTRERIAIGLKKFGRRLQLVGNYSPGWTRPIDQPTGTVTSADHHALLTPPFLVSTNYFRPNSSIDRPHPTQTSEGQHALIVPPFTVETQWSHADGDRSAGIEEPLPTQTAQQGRGLVVPPFLLSLNHTTDRAHDLTEPTPTAMPQGNPYLVTPPYLVDLRGANAPRGVGEALSTVCASGNHHGVVVPFVTSFYGTVQQSGVEQALPTQPSIDKHALVLAPFLLSYYTRLTGQQAAVSGLDSAAPTVPGRAVHYLVQPGDVPDVDDCGFRMLQPHEIGRAMAFPDDYVVVGNQRQRVRQYGNAVTPPVMRWLVQQCLAVLS